jgi:hypothetical protein
MPGRRFQRLGMTRISSARGSFLFHYSSNNQLDRHKLIADFA